MLFAKILSIAALVASAVAADPARFKLKLQAVTPQTVNNVYMFDLPLGVDSEKYVKDYFKANGMELSNMLVRTKIQTKLANIVSIQFVKPVDESIVTAITALDVSRVQRIARPTPFIAKESTSALYAPESIHSITGVNDARNKLGLTGKGIKVAIIDSGVDYNHEALGSGFGPGFKVSYGYDLVGDSYSASSPPVEDSDPLDDCSDVSHGTHVSGIVAADATALKKPEWATDVSFTGVAPEATLGAYRVFSCDGGGTESDIIAKAIYMAAEDGSDIINLSLGGGPTFADYSTSVAATRVGEAGHLVISANGNSGSEGTFTGGSPGAAAGGLGIASFDNLQVPKPFVEFSAVKHQFNIGGNNGNFDFTKDYEVVINDPTADELDKLDDGLSGITPAAAGKALLIRWGGVGSNARCTAAARAGAIACILYANTDSIPNIAGSLLIPSLATTHDLGREMLKAAKEGKPLALKVSDKLGLFDLATAGTVSDFSSLGLDLELAIKPDLGGIGGEVYSTVSKHAQEAGALKAPYAVYGGTSMATPYVAGVSALLLQALGRSRPTFDEFRTLLQNTANFAKKHDSDLVDSVAYQGAGLINAYAAITSKTTVYPSRLALNDTTHINQHYKLTVTNKNTRSIDYTVKHQPALKITPFRAGDDATLGAVDQAYTADYATVKFSRNNDKVDTLTFTLAAGASRSFNVHVQPPPNAIQGLFPIYSGYVVVDADGDKVASVPYAGVVGNYKEAPIWVKKSAKYDAVLKDARVAAALTDLGLTPAPNATLTTGVYDLFNGFASTIPENSVHNFTEAGLLVIPIVATSTRFARVEAIYKGRDWSALAAANVNRKTQLHLIGTSIPLNPDATGAITPGGIANLYANPLQRNHYDGDSRPTAYYFEGRVLSNLTDPDAALITLPAGKYQIRFTALKHFGRVNAPIAGNDFDTVYSNTFDIVY